MVLRGLLVVGVLWRLASCVFVVVGKWGIMVVGVSWLIIFLIYFVFVVSGEVFVILTMASGSNEFSVAPARSKAPLATDVMRRYGFEASKTPGGLSGWSDCRKQYFFHGESIHVDPFVPAVVNSISMLMDGVRDDVDAVMDYTYGCDCVMSEGEWCLFCSEVLLLEHPIQQTLEAVVGMVDDMVAYLVRAVVGKEEFAAGSESRLMELVVVLVRFLLLCGGTGVLPPEYSVARFSGVHPLAYGGPYACGSGRSFAMKVSRRLFSLGRCVRTLLRVAWENSVWFEPSLMELLGLDGGKGYSLGEVWRAAVGVDSPLAVFMQNVVGPSYLADGPFGGGHITHEYIVTRWRSDVEYMPMVSETISGSVVPFLLRQCGRYSDFGSVDRQYQIFLHNLHWGFMHMSKYKGLRGSSRFSTDLLSLFGIMVGRRVGGTRPLEFRVEGRGSWQLGGAGLLTLQQNKQRMTCFLSPLSSVAACDGRTAGTSVGANSVSLSDSTQGSGDAVGDVPMVTSVSLEE